MNLLNRKELLHPEVEKYVVALEDLVSGVSSTKRGRPDVVVSESYYYNGLKVSEWCKTALEKSKENGDLKIEQAALEQKIYNYSKENVELNLNFAILKTKYDELKFRMDGLEK